MTTFQDQPLQSRRSVRQGERDSAVVPTTGPSPTPAAPQAPGEPLTYATQGRPAAAPEYPNPNVRAHRTPDAVTDASVGAVPHDGEFRPRDFSPEGRRSASPDWAPQYGGAAQPASPAGTIVDATVDQAQPVEHTLTRRELRALRDAHGISSTTDEVAAVPEQPMPAPVQDASPAAAVAPVPEAVAVDAGTPLVARSTRLDSALAEFDHLAGARPAADPTAPPAPRGRRAAPALPEEPAAAPVAPAAGPAQVAPEVLGPEVHQPAPVPLVEPEVVVAEVVPEPVVAPAPQTTHEVVVEVVAEPSTSTPPTGHWSTQAQLDDETQFGEEKLARNIGATSGAVTTSALVLPSIPEQSFGAMTGSISLPASMSATGAHPAQLDESDLDHLLDPGDHQVANTDSQPVRAIRAVSTHTSSQGVIGTVKPKGTRGLTALIIAATSMAVLVGALFIVLVVTGQLG